jgi:homoserine kinase type II
VTAFLEAGPVPTSALATAPVEGEFPESGKPPKDPFPVREVVEYYGLGRILAVHWLSAGKNNHAQVETDRGTSFLRRSYRAKTVESLRWQVDLLGLLRAEGLPVPVPLVGRTGDPVAVVDDRLFTATAPLPGTPYDPESTEHPRAAGRMLAAYHDIADHLGLPDPPDTARESLLEGVLDRLPLVDADEHPELYERCTRVADRLAALWPQLPTTVVHGGCRRGSFLFTGDEITGLLDFDSARRAPRVLDLATAVHDVGKVYTSREREDHKVALDLDRVAQFVGAYLGSRSLTPAEVEAVAVLIAAKRAQRALGRAARLQAGEELSENDIVKIRMETARLAWLQDHSGRLDAICAGI